MGSPAGKAFNARLPEALHRAIKKQAATAAQKDGGQTNMNKVIIETLFEGLKSDLSAEELAEVQKFIEKL